jgi:hypothetical protein
MSRMIFQPAVLLAAAVSAELPDMNPIPALSLVH